MITKVVHGWRQAGLLAYLLGPGEAEVHRDPRVIASWDGLDAGWQPERTGQGEYDLQLSPLVEALHAPAVVAGLPLRAPEDGTKRGYVWHCSARVAAGDRVLSDAKRAGIARDLLGAGIAARGDAGGPRWLAVRHADDHIHIAAVLVRQDTGRRFWPHHDYPKLRATARRIEQRLGLTVTAATDGTAVPRPSRGELEKAARQGRTPARPELRRAALRAALVARDSEGFVAELQRQGYLAELRYAPSGDPLGYKLARPGDVTAAGRPVFYSGSKLAPDLSLPQLQRRWTGTGADPATGHQATLPDTLIAAADDARRRLHAGTEDGDGVAHAADLLTGLGMHDPAWLHVAERFDRAARPPGGRVPDVGPAGTELRRLARGLLAVPGRVGRQRPGRSPWPSRWRRCWRRSRRGSAHGTRSHQARAAAAAGTSLRQRAPAAALRADPVASQQGKDQERRASPDRANPLPAAERALDGEPPGGSTWRAQRLATSPRTDTP